MVIWDGAQVNEFRPPSDKCSTSVRSNQRVPIKQIVRWQKFNGFNIRHRTFAPMKFPANDGLPTDCAEQLPLIPITHRPRTCHTPHRRQDKSVIRRPLIGSSSELNRWGTGSTAHQSVARRQSIGDSVGHKFLKLINRKVLGYWSEGATFVIGM